MSLPRKPISLIPAVLATVAAVFELAACFFLASGHSTTGQMTIMLLAETVLIAAAVAQWVTYFRRYIAWQVDERLQDLQDHRVDVPK